MLERKRFCDGDCNRCPLVTHPNNRQLVAALNEAYDRFGDEFYSIIQAHCPNLTVCYDCRMDDFCHLIGCQIIEATEEFE